MKRRPVVTFVAAAALLVAVVVAQYLLPRHVLQLALFDAYQRVFPREVQSRSAVIVGIDEEALAALGQWPWPRVYLAELVDAIAAAQPAAIGFDMYFPEADRTSPAAVAEAHPELSAATLAILMATPSNDSRLAASLAAAPSVIACAGFTEKLPGNSNPLLGADRIETTAPPQLQPRPPLRDFPHVLASLPQLQRAAHGQAIVNSNPDGGVVRRLPLVATVAGRTLPTLSLEMLRVAAGAPAIRIEDAANGIRVRVGDHAVMADSDGDVWIHYSRPHLIDTIPALAVLKGEAAAKLRGRHVLIGFTAQGIADAIATPLGDHRAGVEAHAQLLGAVIDGQALRRPAALRWVELLLMFAAGAAMIVAVPRLRPRRALVVGLGGIALVIGGGFVLFATQGLLFDAASLAAGLAFILTSQLAGAMIETEAALRQERELAARIAGELAAARRIQLGSLPHPDPAERRFDIDAILEPARNVGGDLYDFYPLDARRLFFVIGDVSGKGLPASLFMLVAKALAKSVALRGGEGVAAIVAATGQELARENPESLFVTLLAGILDTTTGAVELCNAGHDAPWKVGASGTVVQVPVEGGPPLCVLDDFDYGASRLQLAPGETLCLITDGITEAMDGAGQFYGAERFAAVLQKVGGSGTARTTLDAVRADVKAFVGNAEPADDLTLLALRWTPNSC